VASSCYEPLLQFLYGCVPLKYWSHRFFDVEPPNWSTSWDTKSIEAKSNRSWGEPPQVQPIPKPSFADDEEKKKLFGIELAKDHPNNLAAAIVIFGDNTSGALWASNNWLTDPIVLASRDLYQKIIDAEASLLDKNQLAAKLLKFSDEKNYDGTRYVCEAKDRLAALKLYSEVMGWTGKASDISVNNSFAHNEMQIRFVTAKEKEQITINQSSDNELEEALSDDIDLLPINLKLISAR
jgi:hypothetical protein